MSSKTSSLVVAVSCVLFSFSALAACEKPAKPELPDPASAVTPQMVKAKNDVKDYMTAAEAFLACNKNTKAHNSMVDEMNDVAGQFNGIVKSFKERMAG